MAEKTLAELKEELKWLEEKPAILSDDGMPSPLLFLGIFGGVGSKVAKEAKISALKKRIQELESTGHPLAQRT